MRMFEMKSLSWGVWLIQKRERGNCKPYLLHYCIYAIYCLKEFPAIMHLFITLKILCQVYLTFKTYWEVTIFSPKIGITWVSALILSISKKKKNECRFNFNTIKWLPIRYEWESSFHCLSNFDITGQSFLNNAIYWRDKKRIHCYYFNLTKVYDFWEGLSTAMANFMVTFYISDWTLITYALWKTNIKGYCLNTPGELFFLIKFMRLPWPKVIINGIY